MLLTPPPWGGRVSRHLVSFLKGLPITACKFEIVLREDYNFSVQNPQKVNPINFKTFDFSPLYFWLVGVSGILEPRTSAEHDEIFVAWLQFGNASAATHTLRGSGWLNVSETGIQFIL